MRYFIILFFFFSFLQASTFIDTDMDGVDDRYDLCPNTPFFALVDKNGCTIKKLKIKNNLHYSFLLGYSFAKDSISQKTYFTQISFYKDDFGGYLYTGKYTIQNNFKNDDLTLYLFYKKKLNSIDFSFGVGSYIPLENTDENKVDYFSKIKFDYFYRNFDYWISFQRTFINDPNTFDINSYSLGSGYEIKDNLFCSASYSFENSLYEKDKSLKYFTISLNYSFTKKWFFLVDYSKSLNSYAIDYSYSFSFGKDF